MATEPIENLTFNLLDNDEGGQVYQKIQAMLAKLKETVSFLNGQIVDGDDIASQIAALQDYLNNFDGVASVNGKSGIAVLTAADVKALPDTYTPAITDVTGLETELYTLKEKADQAFAISILGF